MKRALKLAPALFSIAVGINMFVAWAGFYISGQIPELKTKPIEIGMHLAAEFATAGLLIIGGLGLLGNRRWGLPFYLISNGMLAYTLISSPGYFIQNGLTSMVLVLAALFVLTVYLLARVVSTRPADQ